MLTLLELFASVFYLVWERRSHTSFFSTARLPLSLETAKEAGYDASRTAPGRFGFADSAWPFRSGPCGHGTFRPEYEFLQKPYMLTFNANVLTSTKGFI